MPPPVVETLLPLIREATESDLPALEWEGEYRHFRALFRTSLMEARLGQRALLLAEQDRRLIGQLFVHLGGGVGGTGYLYAFRVRPEVRNRGIGTRLIEEAELLLRRRGCRRAVISVGKDNPGARRLYERLGYRVCAEDPGQWSFVDDQGETRQVSEPSYVLEKRL
jgi:ribosomal protein S18 acetylase RimI-like enzyme